MSLLTETQTQHNADFLDENLDNKNYSRAQEKITYENNKLEKRLCRLVGQAIEDFAMIEDGDRIMVCLSGGKDSYAMLDVLLKLQKRAPIKFELICVNLDQKQPEFPAHILPDYLTALGVPFHIETQDTYSIVKRIIPEGKTTCSLCSRLRRGILYRVAKELKATKIALGHHKNDIMETLLLNIFYGGSLKGMPAKLKSDNGEHIVIRPLAYVDEEDLIRYSQVKNFPIIPCNLCGSQPNLKRQEMKELIHEWQKKYPGRIENLFASIGSVVPSHLMDTTLFNFKDLQTQALNQLSDEHNENAQLSTVNQQETEDTLNIQRIKFY